MRRSKKAAAACKQQNTNAMIMSMKVLSEIRRLHRQKSNARNPELIVTMTQIPIASNPSNEDAIEESIQE
jgi:hypothetical protein